MKILIVEDEKLLAESVEDLLTARGFESNAVENHVEVYVGSFGKSCGASRRRGGWDTIRRWTGNDPAAADEICTDEHGLCDGAALGGIRGGHSHHPRQPGRGQPPGHASGRHGIPRAGKSGRHTGRAGTAGTSSRSDCRRAGIDKRTGLLYNSDVIISECKIRK